MSICTFPLYPQNISKRMVNEFLKRKFNATVYMEFEHVLHLQSMKTIRCRYLRQPMCLLKHFCYSKIHFHQLGPFMLIKNNVEIFKCFSGFISSIESLSKW